MNRKNRLSAGIGLLTLLLGALFAVRLEADRVAGGTLSTWLPAVGDSPSLTIVFYDNLVMAVGFLLSPLLVFAVGYLFGRNVDLPREYGSVLGALLLGTLVGYGVGRSLAVVSVLGFEPMTVLGIVAPALLLTSARVVFVGFAGVALGYLRASRTDRPPAAERTSTD